MRFCRTCKIIKDIRVFHCKYCNLCIERHGKSFLSKDHHCPWLSNCIGEKNHRLFIISIVILFIHTTMIMSEEIYLTTLDFNKNFNLFEKISLLSILVISSITFVFLTCLLFNQLFFISKNITTSEYKRNKYGSGVFPFDKGVSQNFKQFFCSNSDYKKDITYNVMGQHFLSQISLVYCDYEPKQVEILTSDTNSLEMSFKTK